MEKLRKSTVILISLFSVANGGPACLECNDSVSPTDCETVRTCGNHEECFVDAYVTSGATIRYSTGCRDRNYCLTGSSGKRAMESKLRTSGVLVCSECCNDTLCNSDVCGATGYPQVRGPLCYNCNEQTSTDDCTTITMCGQDEVCMLHSSINTVTHVLRYQTQCQHKQQCMNAVEQIRKNVKPHLVGRKRENNAVETNGVCLMQCCDEDLCNNNCTNTASSLGGPCRAQLYDGSFEGGTGWKSYRDGYTRQQNSSSAQNGQYYITVTDGGAFQNITFSESSVTSFTLSGYSRAHSVITYGNDYSIYCDLIFTDGSKGRKNANFDPTQTSSWHKATLVVKSSKQISRAMCYAMFRNGSGSVDFDNFTLESCS